MTVQISGDTGCSAVQDNTITSAKIVDGAVTNTDLATPVATATLCKAWCNFDGTLSGTITPRASFGIASIVKLGTGRYTITLSTAMANAGYAALVTGGGPLIGAYPGSGGSTGHTTTTFEATTINTNTNGYSDFGTITVAVFGN